MAVTQVAKLKTTMRMIAISVLLWRSDEAWPAPGRVLGEMLLVVAVGLTLWSMVVYLRVFWRTVQETDLKQ